jgi:hypothetical protein
MALPLMTEVFLVEASMRAWSQLGFSPEAKAAAEKELSWVEHPIDVLDIVTCLLPLIDRDERRDRKRVEIVLRANSNEVSRVIGHLENPKFKAALRKQALKISRLDATQGWGLVSQLKAEHPPPDPEHYNSDKKVALDLGDGWRWIRVEWSDRGHEACLMQHCGYAVGDMYSLRDPKGKPHATLEVITDPAGSDSGPLHYDPGISQIKGKQNAPPAEKYWPMIKRFVDELPESLRTVQEWSKEWAPLRGYLGQSTASVDDEQEDRPPFGYAPEDEPQDGPMYGNGPEDDPLDDNY